MNLNASQNMPINGSCDEGQVEEEKTSDIFGKLLRQFKDLPGAPPNSPPLVFWLLAGYFRSNPHFFKTEGLFRVAAPEADVRELETHMS